MSKKSSSCIQTLNGDKYLSGSEKKWCICQHSLINLQLGSFSQILGKYYFKEKGITLNCAYILDKLR